MGRMSNKDKAVHLSHCNQGEYSGSCKYGSKSCPALKEDKLPKNLKAALEDNSLKDFSFEDLFDINYDPYDSFASGNWEAVTKTIDYQIYEAVHSLISEAAKEFLGFSHSSDILDDASDSEFSRWSNSGMKDTSYDEESSEEEISRWDQYESVKENFRLKLDESLGSNSLTGLESFKKLFTLAKEMGFGGSEAELERIIKNSSSFRDLAKTKTTKYTG